MIPARELAHKGAVAAIEHFYKQDPKSTEILVQKIIAGSEVMDHTFDLACIIYEVYARIEYGDKPVDFVKNNYEAVRSGYYASTTPQERAGWEGIVDVTAILGSGGLKYLKNAQGAISTASKTAKTVKATRNLERGTDTLGGIGKLRSPWKKNGNLDMDFQRSIGCHAEKKHVGKTDAQLAETLINDKWPKKPLEATSTYETVGQMEHAATTIVKKNAKKIQEWLKNPEDPLRLEHDFGSPIGRVLLNGEKSSSPTNLARVVLKANNDSPDGYSVITTFPIKWLTKKQ